MLSRSRSRLLRFGAIGLALAAAGFLVAASGILPIKASSGHWPITSWMLQFAKRRSVSTHTLMMDRLALDEPWLVLKGAGHYESGCRPCHGGPDLFAPRVGRSMTPQPPNLTKTVPTYTPEELFYIVKHGIKFTGMPAWPSLQRDDEVRAMVAFLLALPDLEPEEYRELVEGEVGPVRASSAPLADLTNDPESAQLAAARCARCHGDDGRGRGNAAFPALAGQQPAYLFAALEAYARSERHSGIMQPIAASLTTMQARRLADYYADLPAGRALGMSSSASSAALERGKAIAHRGIPETRVPACVDCHGPVSWIRDPAYPTLAGQYADYLVLQLELFNTRRRGGADRAQLMRHVAPQLTLQQMRDVALYFASLSP